MASYAIANPYVSQNRVNSFTSTTTSGGTTTLTSASNYWQFFFGSLTQTLKLPLVTSLVLGQQYQVDNYSTGSITVQISSSASNVVVVASNQAYIFTCVNVISDAVSSWHANRITPFVSGTLAGDVTGATNSNLVQFVDGLPIISSNPLTTNLSTYFGYSGSVPTGIQSVGIGYQALNVNTGTGNVATGIQAMAANTSGIGNVAVGYQALQSNTTFDGYTAIGYQALQTTNHAGSAGATAYGYQSQQFTTSGRNTSFGQFTLRKNTIGTNNSVFGYAVSQNTFTSSNNSGIGNWSLLNNNGRNNTIAGLLSGMGNVFAEGTVTQAGTNALTGTGTGVTGFTQDMVGGTIWYDSAGVSQTITKYNSSTSLTVSGTSTGTNVPYSIFYPTNNNTSAGAFAHSAGCTSNNTALGAFALSNVYNTGTVISTNSSQGDGQIIVNGTGTNFTGSMIGGYIYCPKIDSSTGTLSPLGKIVDVVNPTILYTQLPVNFSGSYFIFSQTSARYGTGTAGTGGVASTTLTGSGTNWRTNWILSNASISIGGQIANIISVDSATSITLATTVTVANGTGYIIFLPYMGNTAIGYNSGSAITTGFNNTIIGSYTGAAQPISGTGDGYVVISNGGGQPKLTIPPGISVMFGRPKIITAGYTMEFNDSTIVCNATLTLTLLAAATYPGRYIYIKKGGAFTIISNTTNVVLLAGITGQTAIIGGAGAANWALLQSNGTNWITMMGA